MEKAFYRSELTAARLRAAKPMLWLAMASMSMIFAGLTSAYVVRADNGNWLIFKMPATFFISTALITASSLTMLAAFQKAKLSRFSGISWHLFFTLLLGIAFTVCQLQVWSELTATGIVFGGKYSNAAGSFLYALTGMHLFHLAGGLIAVFVTWIKSLRKKYSAYNTLGLELCAMYWHFLTALWLYLFLFLYFFR